MDLALSDDQQLIRDSAQTFLADAAGSAALRSALAGGQPFDASLWERIGGELGWCATAIPEPYGGLGLGPLELALIVEQTGRRLLFAPFFTTVCLAAPLVLEAGTRAARQALLPAMAAGRLRATAVHGAGAITLRRAGSLWRLTGEIVVPGAAAADRLLFVCGSRGTRKVLMAATDARGVTVEALPSWDATRPMARVRLRDAHAERVDDPRSASGVDRAEALSRLYLAAEQLGGAQQCLDLALRHVTERRQFGRPIASFQAVKHRCADMMVRIEGLRSAVYGAAVVAASRPPVAELQRECAMAKALASEVFFHCAQEAIQLHGGVGFTVEYDPHLYFKRAQATSHFLGTAEALRERIAASLLD